VQNIDSVGVLDVEGTISLDAKFAKLAKFREGFWGDLVLFYEIGRGKPANDFHLISPMFMLVLEISHRLGGLTTFGRVE
jgi:hypothetical protein